MKILWESQNWPGSKIEPSIQCLSWIPTSSRQGRGLLGVGSESGIVGISYTDIGNEQEGPKRHNFNLRGHHSPICIVTWNKTQTKLASCDSGGIIYVWIPNEERWTVELVNDRGVKVRDFNWSPNGTLALICYEDNFVLIGSSTGQRVWSNAFLHTILCGAWAPSSQEFCLGTGTGSIQVFSEQGILITERSLFDVSVRLVSYGTRPDGKWTLAAVASNDQISFLNSFYEVEVRNWQSCDPILSIHWSTDGTMLAVVCSPNKIVILNNRGRVIHSIMAPTKTALTAFCWSHEDQAMIVAAGGALSIGRVIRGVPTLSNLVSYSIWLNLGKTSKQACELLLPERERLSITQYDHHIIRCRIPSMESLPSIVCQPSEWRWYCTIVPVPRKHYQYMLCLEHLGGLIPILLGRQINRIIPQFVISLPPHIHSSEISRNRFENGSSAQVEDLNSFTRESRQRNSVWRRSKRQLRRFMSRRVIARRSKSPPNLVQVQSNVWCTRFKITSVGLEHLPHSLAQVLYKTSVLHLQPRQMTIHLCDLKNSPPVEATSGSLSSSQASSIRRSGQTRQRNAACNTSPAPMRTRSSSTETDSVHTMVVAPVSTFSEGIIAAQNFGNNEDAEPLMNSLSDLLQFEGESEELMAEERKMLHNVLSEFDSLKDAVNNHIKKMKEFAHQLELSTNQIACSKKQHSTTNRTLIQPFFPRTRTSLDAPIELMRDDRPTTSRCLSLSESELRWQSCVDAFDYIDEDESVIVAENVETSPLVPPTAGISSTSQSLNNKKSEDLLPRRHQKQLNDIRLVVEKLSALANELSSRLPSSNFIDSGRIGNLRLGNNAVGSKPTMSPITDDYTGNTSVSLLRDQVCDIARQVAQLEEKIKIDNLLKEIRCDLQQRIQHIKSVLGETSSSADIETEVLNPTPSSKCLKNREPGVSTEASNYRTLTMTNKTPFWNEQAQVYQLDFGGRVTQESAKNFQIEYQSEQVMQFGRIENGAYTLDFSRPFCAIQAFGIALASITQRLK